MRSFNSWNRARRGHSFPSAVVALFAFATLAAAPGARAQFLGDVFFANPSVAVAPGQTAELEVVLFAGAEPVGATHIEVEFDAARARVVAVEPGQAEMERAFSSDVIPGRLSFVALNTVSLEQPIGTVLLARLQIRPNGGTGSRVPLAITVRDILGQDLATIPGRGFAGEIVVGNAQTTQPPAPSAVPIPDDPTAAAFGRPGAVLERFVVAGDGALERRRVRVPAEKAAQTDVQLARD
ncbi:MAG: hypothetical protein AAGF23_07130 [Acidobacteriota bacterium]